MQNQISDGVRPAGVAGFFYPSSPERLTALVNGFLGEPGDPGEPGEPGEPGDPGETGDPALDVVSRHDPATTDPAAPETSVRPTALVVPHAGYDYSGAIAGTGFATMSGHDYDVVVLIGPSHLESFPGVSLFPGIAYQTPLGECALAADLAGAVMTFAPDVIRPSLNGHWLEHEMRQEHALEVELPFLQHIQAGSPDIVPLVMGEQSWETVEALGQALAGAISSLKDSDRVLLVASSDLSHFHPDLHAEDLDGRTLETIEEFDARALYEALRTGKAEACGGGAVAAVIIAAQQLGASRASTIAYAHSGHVSGDRQSVVGYGAVRID
jgi:AmmeMemoRadiSam system protein B